MLADWPLVYQSLPIGRRPDRAWAFAQAEQAPECRVVVYSVEKLGGLNALIWPRLTEEQL